MQELRTQLQFINDLSRADMNLILKIQEQLKRNTQLA